LAPELEDELPATPPRSNIHDAFAELARAESARLENTAFCVAPSAAEVAAVKLKFATTEDWRPRLSVAVIRYVWLPAASEPNGAEKFTPDDAVNGPETFATVTPSICSVLLVIVFGLKTFQLILPFACAIATWLIIGS